MSTGFLKLNVIIEIPKGGRNKYEVNRETGQIWPGRMLSTSTRYPDDYGFIDDSSDLDGDPLGALVLLEGPTLPSCIIICHALGMFRMSDEHSRDDRVLYVPTGDQRVSWRIELGDVGEFHRLETQHFFKVYRDLGPGKSVEDADWVGRTKVEKEILASLAHPREKKGPDAYTYIHR